MLSPWGERKNESGRFKSGTETVVLFDGKKALISPGGGSCVKKKKMIVLSDQAIKSSRERESSRESSRERKRVQERVLRPGKRMSLRLGTTERKRTEGEEGVEGRKAKSSEPGTSPIFSHVAFSHPPPNLDPSSWLGRSNLKIPAW